MWPWLCFPTFLNVLFLLCKMEKKLNGLDKILYVKCLAECLACWTYSQRVNYSYFDSWLHQAFIEDFPLTCVPDTKYKAVTFTVPACWVIIVPLADTDEPKPSSLFTWPSYLSLWSPCCIHLGQGWRTRGRRSHWYILPSLTTGQAALKMFFRKINAVLCDSGWESPLSVSPATSSESEQCVHSKHILR